MKNEKKSSPSGFGPFENSVSAGNGTRAKKRKAGSKPVDRGPNSELLAAVTAVDAKLAESCRFMRGERLWRVNYAIHVEGIGFVHGARGYTKRSGYRFCMGGLDVWLIATSKQAKEWAEIVRCELRKSFLCADKTPVVTVKIFGELRRNVS